MAEICLIRQYYFPHDTRVRREVQALLGAGHRVTVICVGRPGEARHEREGSLTVWRLPLAHRRGRMGRYVFEYAAFLGVASVLVGVLHLRRRFAVVQVNTMPDVLVFAAIIPRLLGAHVLLDLHECMPEFFASKFGTGPEHWLVRLVARAEQASIRFADRCTTCTEQMKEAFVARGAPPGKIDVILNGADEDVFDPSRHPPCPKAPGELVLITHGSVEERYGIDTAIEAVALLKEEIPGLRLDVYGEGSYLEVLRGLARKLQVESRVRFSGGFVPLPELVEAIARADAGVVAIKRDAFRDLALCNKMYDFIAMRKPAIVSRTRAVEATFDESCFQYFVADDPCDLARAIRELHLQPARGVEMVAAAARQGAAHRWPCQRDRYTEVIRSLAARSDGNRFRARRRGPRWRSTDSPSVDGPATGRASTERRP